MGRAASLALVVLLAGSPALANPATRERPNVVFIMADDQGAWTLGSYGNREIQTPNLDRLASAGVRFTRAFCTTPVCSPSRATFLTGRIPSQHGIHEWISRENVGAEARQLLGGEIGYSQILARDGYVCGWTGKWHLGDSLRRQQAFSTWFVHPTGGGNYAGQQMVDGDRLVASEGYVTDRITDRALEFLKANRGRRFYLNVHYTAPHAPWNGHPSRWVERYRSLPLESFPRRDPHPWASALQEHRGRRESMAGYAAAISAMDEAIGRILGSIEALGLKQRTLVVFTSDHGFNFGHHGLVGKGNASTPRNMYDTSMAIPLLFAQPGRLPAGASVERLVGAYDFLPTLLDYLGLPAPRVRNLPGRSFAPLLAGRRIHWEDVVYGEYGTVRMIRTAAWKYIERYPDGPHELYDLASDPGEERNVASVPATRSSESELRARLRAWFRRYAEPGADPVGLR